MLVELLLVVVAAGLAVVAAAFVVVAAGLAVVAPPLNEREYL